MPLFEALIAHGCDAVCLIGATGEVLFASRSSVKISGYPPSELAGRYAFNLFDSEDHEALWRAWREVLTMAPGPRQLEVRGRQKDGKTCWVEATISNFFG